MNRYYYVLIPFILSLSGACSEKINTEFQPWNLSCEYMKEAVVAKSAPRFSWEISSTQPSQKQTAWQLIVSDNLVEIDAAKGSTWDSGKTMGDETFGIKWQGDKLNSFTKYYWKVRAWDRDGNVSNWSEAASFITGSFNKNDWKAKWIGDQP